jgi:hypothetical protein
VTSQPDRSAITDRREQVAGFRRPEVLGDGDLRTRVAEVREQAELWQLWRQEWVIVASSDAKGAEGKAEMEARFKAKYDERVEEGHWRILPVSQRNPDRWEYRLELFIWNVKGEFKRRELAEGYLADQREENPDGDWGDELCRVVAKNSRDAYKLREYGTRKLAKAR